MKALQMTMPKKAPSSTKHDLSTLKGGIGNNLLTHQQILNIKRRAREAYAEREWNKFVFRVKHRR